MRVKRAARLAALALTLAGVARPARAQLFGGANVPFQRTLTTREEVEQESETARFRLGPVKVMPVLGLRDVGYNDNVTGSPTNPVSDWTATIAGGAKVLVPFGEKWAVRGAVVPEYTWYLDSEDLRSWGGTYTGSLVALFNRLTLEAGGGYQKKSEIVSSEAVVARPRRTTEGKAELEVDVLPRFAVLAGYDAAKTRYDDAALVIGGAPTAANLDRDETLWKAGVLYRLREWFSLGAQVLGGTQRFVTAPQARDNDQKGWAATARYDQERFYVSGSVGQRKSEARYAGSLYEPFDTTTYSYFVSWFVAHPVELQVGGSRGPVPSVSIAENYYLETRNFAALNVTLGQRFVLRGYGSLGTNAYSGAIGATPGTPKRNDDVTDYGVGASIYVARAVSLTPMLSRYRTDSNYVGADRTINRLYVNLVVDFGLETK
ncbi:MAG: outer membrane beta-barrel protein [Thermoanaerobaculia bacterium]